MGRLTLSAREEVRASLAGLSGSSKRNLIQDLAHQYGVTEQAIYRVAAASARPTQTRARRKAEVSPAVLDFLLGLTVQADLPRRVLHTVCRPTLWPATQLHLQNLL